MSNFFKNENERMVWVKLNAERIQYSLKITNNIDKELGEIGERWSCMQISLNQLVYDENERDKPRFTLEELILLSPKELYLLSENRNKNNIKNHFRKFLNK